MLNWDELWRAREAGQQPGPAPVTALDPERASKYARAAVEREVAAVAGAPEGVRNDTLNRAGFSLAQLVAAGHVQLEDVRSRLIAAARHAGLGEREIVATLSSSLGAGAQHPRVVADLPPLPQPTTLDLPAYHANGVAGAGAGTGDAQDGAQDAEGVHIATTWAPVDLTPYLDGTHVPEVPTLLLRSDEHALLYPGRVHSLHGESESGKSLVAQVEAVRQLEAGASVLYLDFESDAGAIVGRLLELGADPDTVARHFTYVRPETDPRRFAHEAEALGAVLAQPYALVVIDGVTDALGVFGFKSADNDDLSAFMRSLPRMLASRTGGAVVLIDHVTKNADTRGRFAIGGQAKMAALDGAAYVVEVIDALGRGLRGAISLRVAKDRPGGVRPHCGPFRKLDNTQEAAHIVVDSTADPGRIDVAVDPPRSGVNPGVEEHRPTRTMQRVWEYVAGAGEGLSLRALEAADLGKRATVRHAVDILVREGYLGTSDGPRRATLHSPMRRYAECDDPKSDRYIEPFSGSSTVMEGSSGMSAPECAEVRHGALNSVRQCAAPPKGRRSGALDPGRGEFAGESRRTESVYAEPEPCPRCGASVGRATAEVTGGRCSACYQADEDQGRP